MDSRDSEPVIDTTGDTEVEQESEPPRDSEQFETGKEPDTADSGGPPLAGESFKCGEWVTKAAPSGLTLLREADLVLEGDSFLDGEFSGSSGAFAADTDGDGCSEIVLASALIIYEGYHSLIFLPGTLSDTVSVVERATAIVRGEDDHYLQEVGFGDLDGDGRRDDWALGAMGLSSSSDGFSGAVYLFHDAIAGFQDESYADFTIWPPDDASIFCEALQVGDNGGDSVSDLAVGGSFGQEGNGRVVLFEGPLIEDLTPDDAVFSAESDGWVGGGFGDYIAFDSDLNGDGFADLVPTAYVHDSYRGAFYVFHGPVSGSWRAEDADRVIVGESAWMSTGHGISGGADANGDGYDDLLVGSPGSSYGAVYLVLGPVDEDETLADAGAVFYGDGMLGLHAVSLQQDMDADGFPDPAMGSRSSREYSSDPWGAAFLFYGPVSGSYDVGEADAIFYEDDPDAEIGDFGGHIRGIGDTDGDGFDDLLMGHAGAGPDYVFRGGPR